MAKFTKFARLTEVEFADIVLSTQDLGHKLRIYLKDRSFIDFFYTTKTKMQGFSIHWERAHIDKAIYRLDNTPDKKWRKVKTFPLHFHDGKYESVKAPPDNFRIEINLEALLRAFLSFAKNKLS